MPQTWDELIEFYHEIESAEDWPNYVSMEALVRQIIGNRDVSALHPFTSHDTLCLTKHATYDLWKDRPTISIDPASAVFYLFTLTEPIMGSRFPRQKSESVWCPPEHVLEVYDEMIGKLEKLESTAEA
jgi:hypothetical protein